LIEYICNGKCKFLENYKEYCKGNQYDIESIPADVLKFAKIKKILVPIEKLEQKPIEKLEENETSKKRGKGGK
jgi:hypothetical protein